MCGPAATGACAGPPDGTVDVVNDVQGVLDKYWNTNALQKARADLLGLGSPEPPETPDQLVGIVPDVMACLDAFVGTPYPFDGPQACGGGGGGGGGDPPPGGE